MATTLKMKIKAQTMESLFDNLLEYISIKYYRTVANVSDKNYDLQKKYLYEIEIRHPNNIDAKEQLIKEIAKIENQN